MKIDLLDYILKDIGDTDWWGETNHDHKSSENLSKLDTYLTELENIREELLRKLFNHIHYRKGNGSAESLHYKAKSIDKKHMLKEYVNDEGFEEFWENEN